jgi:NhaA family Na+:H+ antiporter
MPLFALSNAGIVLQGEPLSELLTDSITIGIIAGLIGGKFLGVVVFTWIAVRLRIVDLPQYATWVHIIGAGFLAGVGFTMSLFITTLAFEDPHLIADAKVGILAGSLIAGLVGYFVLRSRPPIREPLEP